MKNPYKILGVSNTATQDEIRKARNMLVKKYHPDVGKENANVSKFEEVQEAYEILSNKVTRDMVDSILENENKYSYNTAQAQNQQSYSDDNTYENSHRQQTYPDNEYIRIQLYLAYIDLCDIFKKSDKAIKKLNHTKAILIITLILFAIPEILSVVGIVFFIIRLISRLSDISELDEQRYKLVDEIDSIKDEFWSQFPFVTNEEKTIYQNCAMKKAPYSEVKEKIKNCDLENESNHKNKVKNQQTEQKGNNKILIIIIAIILIVAIIIGIGMPTTNAIKKSKKYNNAVELLSSKNYEEAYNKFEELGDYKDANTQMKVCKYKEAMQFLSLKKYEEAYKIFNELENYKDSIEQAKIAMFQVQKSNLKGANVGDVITFGTYANEEIEWQVIAKEDNKVLIITKNIIECKSYNNIYTEVTWETCSLRSWLNDDFYNRAFSDKGKSLIQTTKIVNKDNSEYGTDGGIDTKDKIFLLSTDEANKYFTSYIERECQGTSHAKLHGLYVEYDTENSQWWLRSPGDSQNCATYVDTFGDINYWGEYVDCYNVVIPAIGVRPTMWINIDNV